MEEFFFFFSPSVCLIKLALCSHVHLNLEPRANWGGRYLGLGAAGSGDVQITQFGRRKG